MVTSFNVRRPQRLTQYVTQRWTLRRSWRSAGFLALVSVAAPLLSACGGTTVESSDTGASPVSITQESSVKAVDPVEAQRRPADDPAHEVSSLPERKPQLSVADEQMLENLTDEGIDVAGYEVQLVGLSSRVCQEDSQSEGDNGSDSGSSSSTGVDEIVGAVAGQLVEQGKTKKSVEDTAAILSDVVEKAYC